MLPVCPFPHPAFILVAGSLSANVARAIRLVEPHGKDGQDARAKEGQTQGKNSHPVSTQEASYFLHAKHSYGKKKVYLSNLKKKMFTK